MNDLFLLSEAQMRRIDPYFPLSHGIPRVDDRRVISGIVFVLRNGLRWRDAPRAYGPHKTIYNRFVRWSRLGVFNKIFAELAGKAGNPRRIMIDATHLKAHRTAASLLKNGADPRRIGRTRGGLNSKLHAVCDGRGRPLILLLSEGQMSDYKGAALMLDALPRAKELLGDKVMMPVGSAKLSLSAASRRASLQNRTGKHRLNMTACSTASVTKSRTCLAG